MANRSMDAKYKRAVSQRHALGAAEGNKPAYRTNKPLLREMWGIAQHVPKNCNKPAVVKDRTMVVYNPSIYRAPKPLALRCAVACDGELVRKADYLRK